MEQDEREAPAATRSQNVVLTLPHDWAVIGQFLTPALERVDPKAEGTQLLVIVQDADAAVAVAQAAPAGGPAVVPVTGARRAERLIRARGAAVLVGAPAELAALVASSALKLDTVRTVIIAWGDEVVTPAAEAPLETLMGELPKDAARTMVVARQTADADAFVERYMRRARRAAEPAASDAAPVALQYVSVAPAARVGALRRLLDEVDPPSAAVVVRSAEAEAEVAAALRSFGYPAGSAEVRVVRAEQGSIGDATALVVLYDVPADAAALRRVTSASPVLTVAFAQPRQLAHLRAVAGGRVSGYTLPEPASRARQRDDRVRGDLRAVLASGIPPREVLTLEPLLEEFDALEVAAAALRLLERERERAAQLLAGTHTGVTPKGGTAAASAAAGAHRRIFMTIGERDGVSPADIVGAVANEGGVTGDKVGRVEIRDNHTLVEVASADVERVVEKLNGANIRGRRIVARLDQERAEREASAPRFDRKGPPRGGAGGDRGPRKFDRDDRGPRREFGGGDRGPRRDFGGDRPDRGPRGAGGGFDRGPRPGGPRPGGPRPGGFDRGARPGAPGRGPDADRGPRGAYDERDRPGIRPGAAESGQWASRGEQLNRSRAPRRDDA